MKKAFFNHYMPVLFSFCMLLGSCKKFVEVAPPNTDLVTATVFSDESTAVAAIRGIYGQMTGTTAFASGGSSSVTYLAALAADELDLVSTSAAVQEFYKNSISPSNTLLANNLWGQAWQFIYAANGVLEGLDNSPAVSEEIKKQLQGEALFIRAFCYFYLQNLFGEVPMLLSTDYRVNALASRTSSNEVYKQIVSDLEKAKTLLHTDYPTAERIRPNKATASALLSRVFLFTQDWARAEEEATLLITDPRYELSPLGDVFKRSSREAIWQLLPVIPNRNTQEAATFIPITRPTNAILSNSLLQSFEAGDQRAVNWVGTVKVSGTTYYYPYKYKVRPSNGVALTEYSMVFRLAEQYLIRAEARARLDKLDKAAEDINQVRSRGGLTATPAATADALLAAIEQERRVELFTEWGHRWLDLKRLHRADAVLAAQKAPYWQPTDQLFPIPQSDILNNPNLSQNPGY